VPLSGAIGYVRVFGMRLPRASRLQVFFERNHLQEPHHYIRWVGVATSFRGQGLGGGVVASHARSLRLGGRARVPRSQY
jgi:hypothetical protein